MYSIAAHMQITFLSGEEKSMIPRPTTYVMLVRYLRHLGMKIDLSTSFRILVCSDYQQNFFLLITY